MRFHKIISSMLFVSGFVVVLGCSDDPVRNPEQTRTGIVSVLVVDVSGDSPVSGVEIAMPPSGLVSKTDRDGIAVFEVPPGDYFVDASVCCVGPGFIEYHISVTVVKGRTARVLLQACLACV